jgi:hypothetical protein
MDRPRSRPAARRPLLAAAFLGLAACTDRASIVPEVTSESREGSTDVVFQLRDHRATADGGQALTAIGLHAGREVGFDVELGPWRENPPGYVNMSTWQATIRLRSRGESSDALLAFLDLRYATKLAPKGMVAEIEGQALSPWKDPRAFEEGETTIFCSFSPGWDERGHFEVKLSVDREDARVRLREKDPRYRRPLVAALTEPDPEIGTR